MKLIINAGFGELISGDDLDKFRTLGFTGIRQDIPKNNFLPLVDQLGLTQFSAIFLFGGGHIEGWTHDIFVDRVIQVARRITDKGYFPLTDVYFEIGNEPDLAVRAWKENPRKLNDVFWDCYQAAKSINSNIHMVTPGISNLNERGLGYLADFLDDPIPSGSIIGFHRYPHEASVEKPHNGFPSRLHEMTQLRALAGGKKLLCTETGMSEGPHRVKSGLFGLCRKEVRLSQEQVAADFEHEAKFNYRMDVLGMTWYQHRDGPNRDEILDNYGIYDYQGQEKVICSVIPDVANKVK